MIMEIHSKYGVLKATPLEVQALENSEPEEVPESEQSLF